MGMSGWSRAERKHPWWFDEPYRSINRRYLKLRQRLMPYIYTLARETEITGAPMVRGLMWDHPDDPHAYESPLLSSSSAAICWSRRSTAARRRAAAGAKTSTCPRAAGSTTGPATIVDAGPDGRLVDIPVDLDTLAGAGARRRDHPHVPGVPVRRPGAGTNR